METDTFLQLNSWAQINVQSYKYFSFITKVQTSIHKLVYDKSIAYEKQTKQKLEKEAKKSRDNRKNKNTYSLAQLLDQSHRLPLQTSLEAVRPKRV